MIKTIIFIIALLLASCSIAQVSIFSDDFESGSGAWLQTGDISPNSWIFSACSGNGGSLPGTTAMYITSGGIIPGCGITGIEQHAYVNAPVGINEAVSYTNVDAGCLTNLTASFDYRIDGVLGDYAELVYSTNGGLSWTAVGAPFSVAPSWTTALFSLPVGLNGTTFDIGIRFTYDDNTINGLPIAIDNFVVSGNDLVNPTITCPSTQSDYLDGTCALSVGDYTGLAVTGDNCLSYGPVVVSQAPPSGSIIGNDATITLTATDAFGNIASCPFTLQTIDTIIPTLTCPSALTVGTDSGCENTLVDYSGGAVGIDNCTPSISLIYTQSPPAGTLLPLGIQPIEIQVQDANGNTETCVFNLTIEDQTNPQIISCPPNQSVYASPICDGILDDYEAMVVATDNCSVFANLSINQSPSTGSAITNDQLVTINVIDENGNSSSCQLTALLVDTISPIVVCPADFSLGINSSCEYVVPDLTGLVSGSDNCSVLANMSITQSPVPGSTGDGITSVLFTLFDEQSNLATCITTITPIDVTPPTVTCPGSTLVDIGSNCSYVLPNYGSMALVLDNCPNYTITQIPPAGTIASPASGDIYINVSDAGGNTSTCTFTLTIVETEFPTIACPSNISNCNPIVTFTSPVITDNCFAAISQTDLTGLSSGSVFPVGITTLEYTATDLSGNSATCSFDIQILDYPSPANIQEDTIYLCDQLTTVLNADSITSGSGIWTVSSGLGNFNNEFSNTTGVNNLQYGINVFEWTVSSTSCGTLSDSVVVLASQSPIPTNFVEDTILACEMVTFDLIASSPIFGSGVWSTSSLAAIDNPSSNITTGTSTISGWSEFTWTVSNGSCPSTSDTLYVISNLKPDILTVDTSFCMEEESVVLQGPTPFTGQTVNWSLLSGDGYIDNPTSSSTSVSGLDLGVNQFSYTVNHPLCSPMVDSVYVITTLCEGFEPVIPTLITPNFDGKNDEFIISFLNELYPDCRVTIFNRWGSIVFESSGYETPWDGTNKEQEPLPMGTYFYKIELNDEENTTYKGDISIIH